MRLTHLCEYKDKRKNREPMLKIRNKLFDYENIEEKHGVLSLDDLDHRLAALEIIKKVIKYDIEVNGNEGITEYEPNDIVTKEEYDLLKEVLQ